MGAKYAIGSGVVISIGQVKPGFFIKLTKGQVKDLVKRETEEVIAKLSRWQEMGAEPQLIIDKVATIKSAICAKA